MYAHCHAAPALLRCDSACEGGLTAQLVGDEGAIRAGNASLMRRTYPVRLFRPRQRSEGYKPTGQLDEGLTGSHRADMPRAPNASFALEREGKS